MGPPPSALGGGPWLTFSLSLLAFGLNLLLRRFGKYGNDLFLCIVESQPGYLVHQERTSPCTKLSYALNKVTV